MSYQLPFIEERLPNSTVILDEETLADKSLHPIYYIFNIGDYRLDYLTANDRIYQYPFDNPISRVNVEHDGVIKAIKDLDKLTIYYDYTKDFENVFDYDNPEQKISKVLIKNEITAYHYRHKLLLNTNGKNARNIINCIKNDICKKNTNKNDKKNNIFTYNSINIENFMKYMVENYSANVKAIYAGNLPQRENKAIAIYGDETDKSQLYGFIKNQGNNLSCITVKLILKSSSTPKNILFTDNGGIMIFGNVSEELALKIIIESNEIIEEFLNNATSI